MDQIWWRKIVREIVAQRSRTALTVLSIAVGLFAVSLTFRTQAILSRNVLNLYTTTVPPAIVVQVAPVDRQIATSIRRVPGVRAVEGVSHISARARIGSTWRALALRGLADITATQVNRISAGSGAWPAPKRAMLIERSYIANDGVQIGTTLPIELENGRQYQLPVAGSAHDLGVVSGRLGNPVLQGYISLDTAEWLTGSRDVNELLIAVEDGQRDTAQIQAVADRVRDALKDAGCTIVSITVRDPSVPEAYTLLTAVFQTLNVLGGLSLALSACLVVNTTSAMLARHVPQIGVMKAIGARSRNIFATYLGMVLLIAVLALLLALPAAALCAWLLASQLAWLLNYDIHNVSIPVGVIMVELAAGIITPLLVSVYPVGVAARVTVRQALSGVQTGVVGGTTKTRLSVPVQGIPITVLYAARSMFRRKARLILTLAALACGGAIEITVISAQASLSATLDQVAAYWQQDLTVTFNQPERAARVTGEAMQVPGVVAVEQQPAILAIRRRANDTESQDRYAIYGVLPNSALLRPTLVQGRWLTPHDRDAIVVNVDFLKREPDLALGDRLMLKIDGRTTAWQIVGLVTTHLLIYADSSIGQGVGYINDSAFTQDIYQSQRTNRIIITTSQHDAAFHGQVGRALETRFAQFGIQALVQTQSETRGQISSFVSLIVVLLLVMALSFVAIGALSLVGAMSLNVLERTKEIGVLRAIGSSHNNIATIVIIEGTCIGLLSWVPATLLALPLSRILSDVLGWSIVSWPLVYVFPPFAPLLWIGIVVLLSASASYLPARHAARINVRNALEHE
jgi:putative ABC transport system permease protein